VHRGTVYGGCMVATSRVIDAPSGKEIPLNRAAFIRLCAAKGANTEAERAALAGFDRGTIRRWINGDSSPLMSAAVTVARNLDTTIDELWPVK